MKTKKNYFVLIFCTMAFVCLMMNSLSFAFDKPKIPNFSVFKELPDNVTWLRLTVEPGDIAYDVRIKKLRFVDIHGFRHWDLYRTVDEIDCDHFVPVEPFCVYSVGYCLNEDDCDAYTRFGKWEYYVRTGTTTISLDSNAYQAVQD